MTSQIQPLLIFIRMIIDYWRVVVHKPNLPPNSKFFPPSKQQATSTIRFDAATAAIWNSWYIGNLSSLKP